MKSNNKDLVLQDRNMWTLLLIVETICLIVLLKSVWLSLLFALALIAAFYLLKNPELGLAYALTGNILLTMFFDRAQFQIPLPALLSFLAILLVALLIFLFKEGISFPERWPPPLIWTVALLALLIVGVYYSPDKAYASRKVVFFVLNNLVLLVYPIFVFRNQIIFPRLLKFGFYFGIFLALITSWQAMGAPAYVRFSPSENVNPIWFARSLGISALCGIFVLTQTRNRVAQSLILMALLIFLFPLSRSWSRAPLLGLFGAILLFYYLQPWQSIRKKFLVSIPVLVGGLVLLLKSSTEFAARLNTPLTQEISAAFRFIAWWKGLQDFLSHPLTGIGTGGFSMEVLFTNPPLIFKYCHNLFLEVAGENGILGLVILVAFLGTVMRIGYLTIKHFKQTSNHVYLQASITLMVIFIYSVWNSMFSGDITTNEIIWFSGGMIYALYLSCSRLE
ncbi:hypothetical protein GF406_24215 [candidate division KSB1 bacterium]|nr:hypothetical protein [candidate division KSB1 bacterium]